MGYKYINVAKEPIITLAKYKNKNPITKIHHTYVEISKYSPKPQLWS